MSSEGNVEWGSSVDQRWVEIQKKTFTRWANTFLKERMLKVEDLDTDLSDGILLINLLEIISSKSLGRFNKNPKIRTQFLENNQFALNFLRDEGIKLVNIGNSDIVDGKQKLILGLIWTIILRYQIHIEEGKSARSDLLKWVQQQIPDYNIKNFGTDWNDGKAICALADSLLPGVCPNHKSLDPNSPLYNAELGCDVSEKELNIPKVLDPKDMINPAIDELSMMTYISYFRDWLKNEAKRKGQEELEKLSVASKCRAYGPGLEKGETNVPTDFTIEAINQFGKRVNHGNDDFQVSIQGPKQHAVPTKMTNNGDGTYKVEYTPTEIGHHIVNVNLKGSPIQGSPFKVPISRSPPDSKHSKAYGPGLEPGVVVGKEVPFTIASFNKMGQPMKDGGDKYEVKIKGPFEDVPVDMKDNNDGTYTVKYKPTDVGDHVVTVNLNGEPLPGSPFHVGVDLSLDAPDSRHCIAYGPGLEKGSTAEPSVFTIEMRNKNGEKLKSAEGAPIDVDVTDSNGNELSNKIVDNHDGTLTCTYQPLDEGDLQVDVVIRNKVNPIFYTHIKDSPFRVHAAAGTDSVKTIAFGPGLEDGVTDQLPTHFTIQSKDKHGNNMKKGGDNFEIKIQGPNGPVPAQIKDNEDGTYHVDYKPIDAGKHRIDVTLKGNPIAKSPYTVNVKEGADDSTTTIEDYSFVIQAKNKKGANKKEGGDDFKINVNGPSGAVKADLKDNGNGTYLVSFKLSKSGEYKIAVTLNGQPLKGYPTGINVSF